MLGADGKWSNLDSRVALKLHTVVNAEGELAARTDPARIAALARHGYTLDDSGEIAELTRAVRFVSRRSSQIEGNRARLIMEWSAANGRSAPSVEVLQQIDRHAWAMSRPKKPADLDEASWEARVRDEIAAIDPNLTPRACLFQLLRQTRMPLTWICSLHRPSSTRTNGPPHAAGGSASPTSAPAQYARSHARESLRSATSSTASSPRSGARHAFRLSARYG